MSTADTTLPAGFEALQPFVATWALPNAADRARQRAAASPAERIAFYEAAKAWAARAFAHLDAKPLAELDASERRLMHLMLSLAHVACAVEMQGAAEETLERTRRHVRITRATSELGA